MSSFTPNQPPSTAPTTSWPPRKDGRASLLAAGIAVGATAIVGAHRGPDPAEPYGGVDVIGGRMLVTHVGGHEAGAKATRRLAGAWAAAGQPDDPDTITAMTQVALGEAPPPDLAFLVAGYSPMLWGGAAWLVEVRPHVREDLCGMGWAMIGDAAPIGYAVAGCLHPTVVTDADLAASVAARTLGRTLDSIDPDDGWDLTIGTVDRNGARIISGT